MIVLASIYLTFQNIMHKYRQSFCTLQKEEIYKNKQIKTKYNLTATEYHKYLGTTL